MAHNLCPLFFTFFWFFCGFKIDNDERSTCNLCPLLVFFVIFWSFFCRQHHVHNDVLWSFDFNSSYKLQCWIHNEVAFRSFNVNSFYRVHCYIHNDVCLSFNVYSFCHFVAKSPWVEKNVVKREFMLGFQILVPYCKIL